MLEEGRQKCWLWTAWKLHRLMSSNK
jgi:hypothetical protein